MNSITDEIIIKQSKVEKYTGYVCCIVGFLVAVGLVAENRILIGIFLLTVSPLLFIQHYKKYKNDIVLLKLSENYLWTPKHGYISWDKILKIKFRRVGARYNTYMDIYRSNEFEIDETIDVTSINVFRWNLKRKLKKYVQVE